MVPLLSTLILGLFHHTQLIFVLFSLNTYYYYYCSQDTTYFRLVSNLLITITGPELLIFWPLSLPSAEMSEVCLHIHLSLFLKTKATHANDRPITFLIFVSYLLCHSYKAHSLVSCSGCLHCIISSLHTTIHWKLRYLSHSSQYFSLASEIFAEMHSLPFPGLSSPPPTGSLSTL